ncbi:hypothetical protein BN1058_01921 [Paraliobacillus sp. PM-2]|uniref:FbpB family small basic protein n=1 Tax=Paraliobacillus sp. PM-2 TaxID=1462524 RepID=UPI00061CCDBF|nr:FbpB family small basic protein [Paraliobacillus sp. PM-2]CQR47594.1 hypothetical protein BN1058_01921 [Paraliobacillus sp. PM-2]
MLKKQAKADFETLLAANREEILNDAKKLNEIEERMETKMHATVKMEQEKVNIH